MHKRKVFDIDTIDISYKNLDTNQEFIESLKRAVILSLLDDQLLTREQYDSCLDQLDKHRE